MLRQTKVVKGQKGFTLIELLVVAAIIGILLAIAIPNLLKARISANEANARKSMQTLRDAEGEFFEQDLNNNGTRDFTNLIGTLLVGHSLRCPAIAIIGGCLEADGLVDNSFEGSDDGIAPAIAGCAIPKAGYCVGWTGDPTITGVTTPTDTTTDPVLQGDFGWEASGTSINKVARRDFGVYGDGVIRCEVSSSGTALPGTYEVNRDTGSGSCE